MPGQDAHTRISTAEFDDNLARAIEYFIHFDDRENAPHLYTVNGNVLHLITLDRDDLHNVPTQLFTQQLKDRLIEEDPDTIFYLPSDVVTPQDILAAVEQAENSGGFDSPYGSHVEEIPQQFDSKVLTPPVVDALKRIGVPDDAFDGSINENLSRLRHLAGI